MMKRWIPAVTAALMLFSAAGASAAELSFGVENESVAVSGLAENAKLVIAQYDKTTDVLLHAQVYDAAADAEEALGALESGTQVVKAFLLSNFEDSQPVSASLSAAVVSNAADLAAAAAKGGTVLVTPGTEITTDLAISNPAADLEIAGMGSEETRPTVKAKINITFSGEEAREVRLENLNIESRGTDQVAGSGITATSSASHADAVSGEAQYDKLSIDNCTLRSTAEQAQAYGVYAADKVAFDFVNSKIVSDEGTYFERIMDLKSGINSSRTAPVFIRDNEIDCNYIYGFFAIENAVVENNTITGGISEANPSVGGEELLEANHKPVLFQFGASTATPSYDLRLTARGNTIDTAQCLLRAYKADYAADAGDVIFTDNTISNVPTIVKASSESPAMAANIYTSIKAPENNNTITGEDPEKGTVYALESDVILTKAGEGAINVRPNAARKGTEAKNLYFAMGDLDSLKAGTSNPARLIYTVTEGNQYTEDHETQEGVALGDYIYMGSFSTLSYPAFKDENAAEKTSCAFPHVFIHAETGEVYVAKVLRGSGTKLTLMAGGDAFSMDANNSMYFNVSNKPFLNAGDGENGEDTVEVSLNGNNSAITLANFNGYNAVLVGGDDLYTDPDNQAFLASQNGKKILTVKATGGKLSLLTIGQEVESVYVNLPQGVRQIDVNFAADLTLRCDVDQVNVVRSETAKGTKLTNYGTMAGIADSYNHNFAVYAQAKTDVVNYGTVSGSVCFGGWVGNAGAIQGSVNTADSTLSNEEGGVIEQVLMYAKTNVTNKAGAKINGLSVQAQTDPATGDFTVRGSVIDNYGTFCGPETRQNINIFAPVTFNNKAGGVIGAEGRTGSGQHEDCGKTGGIITIGYYGYNTYASGTVFNNEGTIYTGARHNGDLHQCFSFWLLGGRTEERGTLEFTLNNTGTVSGPYWVSYPGRVTHNLPADEVRVVEK